MKKKEGRPSRDRPLPERIRRAPWVISRTGWIPRRAGPTHLISRLFSQVRRVGRPIGRVSGTQKSLEFLHFRCVRPAPACNPVAALAADDANQIPADNVRARRITSLTGIIFGGVARSSGEPPCPSPKIAPSAPAPRRASSGSNACNASPTLVSPSSPSASRRRLLARLLLLETQAPPLTTPPLTPTSPACSPSACSDAAPVELVLPNGGVLRLAPGCDLAFVRSLVDALGGAPC